MKQKRDESKLLKVMHSRDILGLKFIQKILTTLYVEQTCP